MPISFARVNMRGDMLTRFFGADISYYFCAFLHTRYDSHADCAAFAFPPLYHVTAYELHAALSVPLLDFRRCRLL